MFFAKTIICSKNIKVNSINCKLVNIVIMYKMAVTGIKEDIKQIFERNVGKSALVVLMDRNEHLKNLWPTICAKD